MLLHDGFPPIVVRPSRLVPAPDFNLFHYFFSFLVNITIIIIIPASCAEEPRPGMSARHHALDDLIARSFASAGVPVTKEPIGLLGSDGKRPDWSHTGSVAKRQVVVL